jgi:nucleoside-diphosphate-sugar epimerase
MKVFVAGGTGALGRFALPRLVAAGHDVTAIARSDDKAAAVAAAGATPIEVDLFDADGILTAAAGHDAVVNLATRIPPVSEAWKASAWEMNDRIRREASGILADAALAGGGRFVQESITFTYPDRGAEWIDETVPIDPPDSVGSVLAAEAAAARVTEQGGTGVVLRFGLFYGPGSSHTDAFVAAARKGVGPVAGAPGDYLSSIHLDDAATAVEASLGAAAGVYNIVDDDPVSRRDYADVLVAAVGQRRRIHVPGRLAKLGGQRTATMTRSQRVSNAGFKAATGWHPQYPSVREGWPAVVAALHTSSSPGDSKGE